MNSQEYAQKPHRNCTFMNAASAYAVPSDYDGESKLVRFSTPYRRKGKKEVTAVLCKEEKYTRERQKTPSPNHCVISVMRVNSSCVAEPLYM